MRHNHGLQPTVSSRMRPLVHVATGRTLRRLCVAACCLLLVSNAVIADSWSYKSSKREFKLSQGNRVVVTTDASKSTQSPEFHLKIYEGQKLLAHYPGLAFEHIAESPDGELFVGLSNRGIPGTAAAVFMRDGSLRVLAVHGLAQFDYCRKSATLAREWYDEKNPNVRFDGPPELGGITLRDCRGRQVSLLEVTANAYCAALQRVPTSGRRCKGG